MKLLDALKGIGQLYIETAPLIYYVEVNPTYVSKMDMVIDAVEKTPIPGFSSVITLTEVLVHPLRTGNKQLELEYRDILENNADISLIEVTGEIARYAAELRARYNIRTADALHLSSAIKSGCDGFLTNDVNLKRVTEITVLVLDELDLL